MPRELRKDLADALDPPVDRAGVLRELLGDDHAPRLQPGLPADPAKVEATRAIIGRVHLVERMTPCDGVLSVRVMVADRDPGDECDCFDCGRAA